MPPTDLALAARLRRKVGWWRHRVQLHAADLQPLRRTALQTPPGQDVPPPSAFAAFGPRSWLVPPLRCHGAPRIAVGSDVVVLEFGTLWAFDDGDAASPVLTLGDGVRLTRFCSVVAEVGVTIGDGVASSDMVAILDTWRVPAAGPHRPSLGWPEAAPVVIDDGAYLGMGSIVGPGVHVGAGAYVGENAVVVDDVPAHAVVQGNPARVVRHYDEAAAAWVGR